MKQEGDGPKGSLLNKHKDLSSDPSSVSRAWSCDPNAGPAKTGHALELIGCPASPANLALPIQGDPSSEVRFVVRDATHL